MHLCFFNDFIKSRSYGVNVYYNAYCLTCTVHKKDRLGISCSQTDKRHALHSFGTTSAKQKGASRRPGHPGSQYSGQSLAPWKGYFRLAGKCGNKPEVVSLWGISPSKLAHNKDATGHYEGWGDHRSPIVRLPPTSGWATLRKCGVDPPTSVAPGGARKSYYLEGNSHA